MSTQQRYDKIFTESFSINEDDLKGLEYNSTQAWDSVGHMALMAALESEFGIMLEMEDIVDFSSHEKGMQILTKYGVVF